MEASLEILKRLCDAHGVSGYEDDVRTAVAELIRPLVDEMHTDALGNLIARVNRAGENAPTVLLDAHLDEIGLVISYIEPNGFLRFATVGGWDERVLPAQAVDVRTVDGRRIRGIIGVPPPHIQKGDEKSRPYPVENLFIDAGAGSREEAQELGIQVGDSAVPFYPFQHMSCGAVTGKALDNRAGCTVLIRTLQNLASDVVPPHCNVVATFTTFEETGGRGAAVATYGVNPQLALVLEGTVAGDFPGVPPARNPSRQGAGPAITLVDRTAHFPRRLVQFLQKVADDEGIPHQLKTPIFGGTNGARVQMTRSGVPTGVVSVPCRYIHSAHATLRTADLEHTIELVTAFVGKAASFLQEPLFDA